MIRLSGHGGFSKIGGGGSKGGKNFQAEKKTEAREVVNNNSFINKREAEREVRRFIQRVGDKNDVYVDEKDGRIKASQKAVDDAEKVANSLADKIQFTDYDKKESYEQLRSFTKGKYYLSTDDRHEIDKFREYQRQSKINVTLDKRARTIDSVYTEIYDSALGRSLGLTNPSSGADKLRELNDALTSLKSEMKYGINDKRALYEMGFKTKREAIQYIRDDLIERSAYAAYHYKRNTKKGKQK